MFSDKIVSDRLLNDNFCFDIVLPEFHWTATFLFSEKAVEVGNIIEPAHVTDFGTCHGCVYKHADRVTDTYVNYVVGQGLVCACLEKSAECSRCHIDHIGKVFEAKDFGIVLADVVFDFLYSP